MSRFNRELQLTLQAAMREAVRRRHAYLTVEHLLFALCHDERGAEVLRHSGANVRKLKSELARFLDDEIAGEPGEEPIETGQTLAFHRVIQGALAHAQNAERDEVDAGDLVAAIFQEPDSQALALLRAQGVSRLDVLKYVSHGISKLPESRSGAEAPNGSAPPPRRASMDDGEEEIADPLTAFATNLTERALAGKLDPLVGREAEIDRVIHVLARRRKNNPILVGESGVGKTAIAEGLAQRIASGDVPKDLIGADIYAVDLGAMLAGTRYRGDFEARFKAFVAAVRERPNPVVFIDEIHTVLGAGAAQGATVDASNMLKPLLQNGELRCMGSTTFQEYRHFERDRALARRFQRIEVHEPSIDDAVKILEGLAPHYEKHHGVHYTAPALRACVELSAKHLLDRFLPDKAIDVMDEVGAAVRLRKGEKRKTVGVRDVEVLLSQMAKIPLPTASTSDLEGLEKLDERPAPRGVRPGRGDLDGGARGEARARGARRRGPPGGLVPVHGPDGRRQDRARQAAREDAGRPVHPLRHERVHGEARGRAADRRAARLRRLRPGRHPGRRDPAHALRGAAPRRDREGAPGPVRHPPAGHGPRDPDRQPRARGELPPRDLDHDQQRGRARHDRALDRLRAAARRATVRRTSSACSAPSSATASTRS